MAKDEGKKEKKEEKKELSISPWQDWWSRPFGIMSDFDQIFDDFKSGLRRFFASPWEPMGELIKVPAVDVEDTGDSYIVKADMPGMEKGNVNIEIKNDVLTITAEKEIKEEEKGKTFLRKERSYQSFSRRLPLPKGTEYDKIKASLEKGVLQITIPKVEKEEKAAKKISIE